MTDSKWTATFFYPIFDWIGGILINLDVPFITGFSSQKKPTTDAACLKVHIVNIYMVHILEKTDEFGTILCWDYFTRCSGVYPNLSPSGGEI